MTIWVYTKYKSKCRILAVWQDDKGRLIIVEKEKSGRNTFVVQIVNQQNSTWQGTVTWTERNQTQCFRSALELLRLLDSATGASPLSAVFDGEEKKDA